VHHLLDVCRAIGVHPLELFRLVFKEPRTPCPIIERMATLVGGTDQPRLRVLGTAEDPSHFDALERRLDGLQQQVDELRRRTPGMGALAPGAPSGRRP
jgi:hypothetical protein